MWKVSVLQVSNLSLGLSRCLSGKEPKCSAGDAGSISRWERSHGEGHANPLQYSCLKNPMDRGAWQDTVHGVEHDLVTKQQSFFYRLLFCCFSTTYLTLMVTYQKLIINRFYKYILLQSNLFSKNIRETKIVFQHFSWINPFQRVRSATYLWKK